MSDILSVSVAWSCLLAVSSGLKCTSQIHQPAVRLQRTTRLFVCLPHDASHLLCKCRQDFLWSYCPPNMDHWSASIHPFLPMWSTRTCGGGASSSTDPDPSLRIRTTGTTPWFRLGSNRRLYVADLVNHRMAHSHSRARPTEVAVLWRSRSNSCHRPKSRKCSRTVTEPNSCGNPGLQQKGS
jgi:hypothetical protein